MSTTAIEELLDSTSEEALNKVSESSAIGDMDVSLEVITPASAAGMLKANLPHNRGVSRNLVKRYTSLMREGRWVLSSDAIAFDDSNQLINGQHRLLAILRSNTRQPFIVLRNIRTEYFKQLDTGKTRSAGDVLSIEGYKNYNNVAAVANLLFRHKYLENIASTHGYAIENEDIFELVKQTPSLTQSVAEMLQYRQELRGVIPSSEVGLVYHVMRESHEGLAKVWLHQMATGEGLRGGSPILALRKALLNNMIAQRKMPTRDRRALLVKSANKFMRGEETKVLSWKSNEDFPVLDSEFPKERVHRHEG